MIIVNTEKIENYEGNDGTQFTHHQNSNEYSASSPRIVQAKVVANAYLLLVSDESDLINGHV